MNIVYSSSDAYSECTGISLWSLLENNREVEDIVIYILGTDISDLNRKRLFEVANHFGRVLHIIDAKQDFIDKAKEFNLPLMRGAYNTYSRICLNKWFSSLDRVLVVDSDTLICGRIDDLWNYNLDGKLIGAVPEVAMYGNTNNIEDKDVIYCGDYYYNMGICLVNLKEWRQKGIDEYLAKCIHNDDEPYKVADQSIINKYLNQYIVRVPLKFNYYSVVHSVNYQTVNNVFCMKCIFTEKEFDEAKNDTRIIHYFGHPFERPWFKRNSAYKKGLYYNVRNRTPWKNQELSKWPRKNNWIFNLYDYISYCLLILRARNTCLYFRYVWGQKIKGLLKIRR